MEKLDVTLTMLDHLILDSYKGAMEGLAEYLGSAYELVLHSLEDYEHSVVKIINGYHSGRKEGAPITDLALDMLARLENGSARDGVTYTTRNREGRPLKGTTIPVRGEGGRVIALICINFYLDTPLNELISAWTLCGQDSANISEHFADSSEDLMEKLVAGAVADVDRDPSVTPSTRNKHIVMNLYERGGFRMKGSVDQVAKLLSISPNTVYLHLRKCTSQNTKGA